VRGKYCRKLAKEGKELYIVAGGHGTGGTGKNGKKSTIGKGVTVPESVWKVVLVLDKAQGLNENTRTIAVWMPNIQGIKSTPWQSFRKSVDEIEMLTGYDFYSNVPEGIQKVIELKVDNL
jgi:endonuclease G, mitochondrial